MNVLFLLAALSATPAAARPVQPVLLTVSFQNEQWFPLTKPEMKAAGADTALQELTGANLIELIDENDVVLGRLDIVVSLVERAEEGKVTITFSAIRLPSIVTTASVPLHDLNHDGIFKALGNAGREAGRQMKARLLAAIPPDKVDLALNELLGKDWDNRTTADLYGKAQDLKRAKEFEEARTVFKIVANRKDRGSQQWKRLSDDELAFGLPLFQANTELMGAAEHRRKADLDKIEKLYREIIDKNRGNEARVAEAQHGLDTVAQLRGAMGMVDRSEIKSRVRTLQVAMVSHYMENAQAPSLAELKTMSPELFAQSEIKDFKLDAKSNDYSFEIVLKTGASALVKGNLMRTGMEGVEFREPASSK